MVSHNACVAGCRAEDGLKFHKFPTNAALRALWLSRIPPQYEYAKCGKKIRQKAFPKVPNYAAVTSLRRITRSKAPTRTRDGRAKLRKRISFELIW